MAAIRKGIHSVLGTCENALSLILKNLSRVSNSISVTMPQCWSVLLVNMSLIATFSSHWNVATICNCNP